ncbi:MAG: ABC transporter permease, partial [Burkholderiales bacterium]|nr:ABC transporter permease [Burkholderiales bacterium]
AVLDTPAAPGQRARRRWIPAWRALVAAALFGLWELGSAWMGAQWLPRPGAVGVRICELAGSGLLAHHALVTFWEAAAGMVLGGLGGAALPFLLQLSPRLMRASEPFLAAAFGVPKLALAPLFILWLGIGMPTKIVFVASIVFFLLFYNGMAGVLSVDPRLVAMARVAGAGRRVIMREIVWNTTLPFLFAGLKIALPRALSGAVVGEFIASDAGLGWYINNARSINDTVGVVTGVVVVTVLVILVNAGLQHVQARSLAWRPMSRDMVV